MAKEDDIKKDLIDQLERNGILGNQYLDLVDDYMCMWSIKNKLIKDIEVRGVTITYNNGGGQSGSKKNDSVAEYTKTNAQMLKLLSELGLKAVRAAPIGEDDGDM